MTRFLREHWKALSILVVGAAFLVLGVYRGEAETVLRKAVNVCMECIGLG